MNGGGEEEWIWEDYGAMVEGESKGQLIHYHYYTELLGYSKWQVTYRTNN